MNCRKFAAARTVEFPSVSTKFCRTTYLTMLLHMSLARFSARSVAFASFQYKAIPETLTANKTAFQMHSVILNGSSKKPNLANPAESTSITRCITKLQPVQLEKQHPFLSKQPLSALRKVIHHAMQRRDAKQLSSSWHASIPPNIAPPTQPNLKHCC